MDEENSFIPLNQRNYFCGVITLSRQNTVFFARVNLENTSDGKIYDFFIREKIY